MAIIVTEDNTGLAPRSERYTAYDEDAYDGAPDGCTVTGRGPTRLEAICDLTEAMEDAGYYTPEDAAHVRESYGINDIDPDHLRETRDERRAMMREWDE